ncbi:MAG: hypothetical protein DI563_07835 [Variovorax paradoxus]|uniref:Uncharacterized protein n=1 Tax=Variovorax paradoxus TaxID=34073 RepID=A0A2W5QG04_VARPD|nr:MAG: hypothetical protein DI563_07835 [Variovorax paradoxus]
MHLHARLHPSDTRRRWLLWAAAATLLPTAAAAQVKAPAPPTARVPWLRVRFPRRGGMRLLRGRLQARTHSVRDYVIQARAGQSLEVELETLAPGASFKVLGPQQKDALFMSEFSALPLWQGRLSADGDYRVRVSLNAVQRTRGESMDFILRLALHAA